jgi:NAD(P)-dependent dehydrogenase (short-subunit alcohol dehydrogenase family)
MIALITGAGRGLGRATALELARHGWDLVLLARTATQLEETAAQVRNLGSQAVTRVAAVEDEAAVQSAFAEIQSTFRSLDALVHCAGTGSFAPVAEADAAEWNRIIQVNLGGMFLCNREAVRMMRPQGRGQIVNVLSNAAKVTFPGASAYCASKWGGLALTKSLAEEVRREGIRVTALCPGSIETPFWDEISHGFDPADMLRAEDVAAAIRFVLEQPPGIHTDELVVMPPKGIL